MTKQGGYRVLVVDDLHDNRALLKQILRLYGAQVLEANDGQEAIDLACLEYPQLILMDLSMPVMDGFEATRQLKLLAATRHIPIVAVSAHCQEPEQRKKALAAGCQDCFEKPIAFDKIAALLRTL
jgi:two-component system cell cycle response regulator DivK